MFARTVSLPPSGRTLVGPHRTSCAFCGGGSLELVLDLGTVALAGGFLKPEQFADEQRFPLRLLYCNDCYAVQVADVVEPSILFNNYFYFSSTIPTLREHFVDYAAEVYSRFLTGRAGTAVEIGCNDGVLLRPLADLGVRNVIGIDPAGNVLSSIHDPRLTLVHDFFTQRTAAEINERFGKADVICANNVFAHVPDINALTGAVSKLLADDGVFIFEVHYLGKVLDELQYDMIYHEHLYYYSLLALVNHLTRFDLTVFDLKRIPIHGGSVRYYACRQSSRHARTISCRVGQLAEEERNRGLDRYQTFAQFAARVARRKEQLMDLLEQLARQSRGVVGYGASGRANTIIQYCGITQRHVQCILDDAPAKWGYHTPGAHLPIKPGNSLRENLPDYLLIFAWSFLNDLAPKTRDYLEAGGRMIVPLPDVRIMLSPARLGCW